MERADELFGVAAAFGEQRAAVRTEIVERAHFVLAGAHDEDAFVDHLVDGVVPDLGNFLQPGGVLPDLWPEPLFLEFVKRTVEEIVLGDEIVANLGARISGHPCLPRPGRIGSGAASEHRE